MSRVLAHGDLPASLSCVATTRLHGPPASESKDVKAAHYLGQVAGHLHRLPEEAWTGLPRFGRTVAALDTADDSAHEHLARALNQAGHHRRGCTMAFVHGNLHAATVRIGPGRRPALQVADFPSCGIGCPDEDLGTLYVHHLLDGHWSDIWAPTRTSPAGPSTWTTSPGTPPATRDGP
ncbi:hypothetical protein [Streptomyces abikoensis]|uniref:Aminoglycoside phosphotransferase domain-containing protein n=1 Tax=Streptomyces abikoensis TaxID=97398 RepID=A0ABW7TC33_9ACTN